jgi:anaerobic magnesium-protoporphyrin IX monomethyl ester cyclase
MTDVVLYNPAWNPQPGINGIYPVSPPLDLCLFAAAAERQNLSVSIYDAAVSPEKSFKDYLTEMEPKVIGFNAPSVSLSLVYQAVREASQLHPDVKMVVLGQHVSDDLQILTELGVPYAVTGCSVNGFAKLCSHLVRKEGRLSEIESLAHVVKGKVSASNKAEEPRDESLLPAWHLVELKKYAFLSIAASQGCPYQCLYCGSTGPFCPKSGEYILRKPEAVIAELKYGIAHGILVFDFLDDVFTCNPDYVKKLCGMILAEKLSIRWTCSTRPDLLSTGLVAVMKQAGCVQICIGVESGSAEVRKKIGRDIPESRIRNAFDLCRLVGVKTRASALIGLPGETKDTIEDTISFIKELKPAYALFYPVILLPGSTLFEAAVKEGIVQRDAWACYMHGEAGLPVYVPAGMTRGDISKYLKEAHRRFYNSIGYFFRRLAGARSMSDIRAYGLFMEEYLRETG